MQEFRSSGVQEFRSSGALECWSVGVLECWSVGVLECWSVGVLECRSVGVVFRSCSSSSSIRSTGVPEYWSGLSIVLVLDSVPALGGVLECWDAGVALS